MITEDYVSFEIAKLLKEKGFDEPCESAYTENGQYLLSCYQGIAGRRIKNSESLNFSYSVVSPTLQMAMKWLRDIHGLFIHIDIIREASCWLADIQDIKEDVSIYPVEEDFPNYEEACEAAIKFILENLI